ncbi:MAG TPA: mycoredoxin [Anaerolineales bacterium]|nr:mycoredoxin [Anaerolineales bacterium]
MNDISMLEHIILYGTTWCGDCHRSRRLLDRHSIPYTWIDVDRDPEAKAYVVSANGGRQIVPTILFPDGSILVEPSDSELAAKVGVG